MRLDDPVALLRQGVVGTFVPVADDAPTAWLSGHIRVDDDGAEISVVASTPEDAAATWSNDPANHQVVFGITEAGTVLMHVHSWTRSTTRGTFAVQVVRWNASAVLVDVDDDEVDADNVSSLSLEYFGLTSWSNAGRYDHEVIQDTPGGPALGWRIEARREEPATVAIDEAFDLTIATNVSPSGVPGRLAIEAPLIVRINSNERRSYEDHIVRLDAVHGLLSLAHLDPVNATRGWARLERKKTLGPTRWWDRTMMGAVSEHDNVNLFPIFRLEDLGGADGVAAWIRTCLIHPRSVTPLVRHRLFENQSPESRLLSTAAAMEYWVVSHRRTDEWAGKTGKTDTIALATARSVGSAWGSWIGDSDSWAKQFADTYTELKHLPTVGPDPDTVSALEYAGRWLLTASILDECVGDDKPSTRIFGGGIPYPIGQNVRRRLKLPDWIPEPETADDSEASPQG